MTPIILLAVAGGSAVGSVATVNSLIQTLVPHSIRGRVLSMHTMAFLGFTPVGSLLIGTIAEQWGAPMAVGISCGFALILMTCLAWPPKTSKVFNRRNTPAQI